MVPSGPISMERGPFSAAVRGASSGVSFLAGTCAHEPLAGAAIQPQHPVAAEIGPGERPVRPGLHAIRLVELGSSDGFSVHRHALRPYPNNRDDFFGGRGSGAYGKG